MLQETGNIPESIGLRLLPFDFAPAEFHDFSAMRVHLFGVVLDQQT